MDIVSLARLYEATSGRNNIHPMRGLYAYVLASLTEAEMPFLLGGGLSLSYYTGIEKPIKDLDIFVQPKDVEEVLRELRNAGLRTEITSPHWLAKAHYETWTVDIIYNSGNGAGAVDEGWFENARRSIALGVPVLMVPAEEMIWQKALISERERFDGADVAHLLLSCADTLDWDRLIRRFDTNWRVLLSHIILFGFIYPSERDRIPEVIIATLLDRLCCETFTKQHPSQKICQGTLLSRQQYLVDINQWGYRDGRLEGGYMSSQEIKLWTDKIINDERNHWLQL